MTLNSGSIIAGRYEIIEKIGSGGMAKVYRAKDKKLDRFVTFKVMREDFINDDEFQARFQVEAQAAASLSSQNIVNVYDVGQEDDIHYIVMEYIDGVTLKDLIRKRAPFENDEVLGVAIQIGTGLMHAHENGIIHRDIKPQNIMVTTNGNIKVMDFGIARAVSAGTMTTSGNTMGSVHYFSPEQARGGYIDYKSDIYALGIVMFEMATGVLPFEGETPIAIALKQINDPLPDLKKINPNLSESIVKIILKATEKLSTHRYQTTEEMVSDLKRALTNTTGDFVLVAEESEEDSPTVFLEKSDVEEIKKVSKDARNDDDDDEDYDDDKPSDKKIIVAAVITSVAIILIIIAILSYFVSTKLRDVPDQVEIPTLTGKTLEEANTIATDLGVNINATETYSENVQKGLIMSQDVGDDNKLYEGETIDVQVSLGINIFKVPDVTGKEVSDAIAVFGQEEYSMFEFDDSHFEFSDTIPQGVVIRQDPEGNEMAEADTVVKLYVSRGPEFKEVVVPKVIGKTEADATTILKENGLAAGPISHAESDTVPKGQVIEQTVEPGEKVSINAPVGLIISEGKPEPTDNPEQTPKPEQISKTITVDVPPEMIPAGVDVVNVEVLKITQDGSQSYYNEDISVSDFPIQVPVTGESDADYQVYIRDINTGQNYYKGS